MLDIATTQLLRRWIGATSSEMAEAKVNGCDRDVRVAGNGPGVCPPRWVSVRFPPEFRRRRRMVRHGHARAHSAFLQWLTSPCTMVLPLWRICFQLAQVSAMRGLLRNECIAASATAIQDIIQSCVSVVSPAMHILAAWQGNQTRSSRDGCCESRQNSGYR